MFTWKEMYMIRIMLENRERDLSGGDSNVYIGSLPFLLAIGVWTVNCKYASYLENIVQIMHLFLFY
jgi:hypothetical protein